MISRADTGALRLGGESVDVSALNAPDLTGPVQIADRTWWVGHHLKDDVFQCHVYLLEHGDQSVLVDPGSKVTFQHTLKKIEGILPFHHIRYFICHHQDPDITGAMPLLDDMIGRPDACLVTHWRAQMLIKHYDLKLPFWRIEENDWNLELGGRKLKFIFTPYAHFPGAFCTFDENTGVLFSSDLFGGFTEDFSLIAKDEDHFESLRPFHEHYIPSREILNFSIQQIEPHPVRMIAPQHGSIIPKPLIRPILEKLKELECGLYLTIGDTTRIQRLSQLNQALRDATKALVLHREFSDMARELLSAMRRLLPAEGLEFYARLMDGDFLHLAPEGRYHGLVVEPPSPIAELLAIERPVWDHDNRSGFLLLLAPRGSPHQGPQILLPLFAPEGTRAHAVAVIRLDKPIQAAEDIQGLLLQMAVPLQVAVERETIQRATEFERHQFYERATHDPLTGSFTRFYMEDTVQRLFDIHDRDPNAGIAVALLDLDHFKDINDTYGHNQGDEVLRRVAEILNGVVRSGDLPVRLGGEEFAVFVVAGSARDVGTLAERLRRSVEQLAFDGPMSGLAVTVSIGTAIRRQGESLQDLLHRADLVLYEAKRAGRNRVGAAG